MEPEPTLRIFFGSGIGSSQKGRLRAAPAPKLDINPTINLLMLLLFKSNHQLDISGHDAAARDGAAAREPARPLRPARTRPDAAACQGGGYTQTGK